VQEFTAEYCCERGAFRIHAVWEIPLFGLSLPNAISMATSFYRLSDEGF
jgi:hypothetical protein